MTAAVATAASSVTANPSIYVGDLSPDVSEAMLWEHFRKIGQVLSVRVCVDFQTKKSLGYGYVNFSKPAEATAAIEQLNGSLILGRACRVDRIQRDPTVRKSGICNVVVKGLPCNEVVEQEAVRALFAKFGRITSLRVAADDKTGKARGYAYINYEDEASAVRAVKEGSGQSFPSATGEPHTLAVERYKDLRVVREERKRDFTNTFISGIRDDINTEEKLRQVLGDKYGPIASCKVRVAPGTGEVQAMVAFETHEAAAKCVTDIVGKKPSSGKRATGAAAAGDDDGDDGDDTSSEDEEMNNAAQTFDEAHTSSDDDDDGAAGRKKQKSAAGQQGGGAAASSQSNQQPKQDHPLAKEGVKLRACRFMAKKERDLELERKRREKKLERQQYPNLYVKHIDDSVNEDMLYRVFARFGEVANTRVMRDESGMSREFGFVSFKDRTAADAAISAMNGSTELSRRPLYIAHCVSKDDRRAQIEEQARKRARIGIPGMMMVGGGGSGSGGPGAQAGMFPPSQSGMPGGFPHHHHHHHHGQNRNPALGGVAGGAGFYQQHQHHQMLPRPGMANFPHNQHQQHLHHHHHQFPQQHHQMQMHYYQQQQQQQQHHQYQQQMTQHQHQRMPAPSRLPPHQLRQQQNPMMPMAGNNNNTIGSSPNVAAGASNTNGGRPALDSQYLATLPADQQKNVLGERLYEHISCVYPQQAAKVTGMLLEMDNSEILNLLESTSLLDAKIREAFEVLRHHGGAQ